ncbi:MAG: aminoacyl-tRNA hydrolase [Salinivirgaceae bacterium]|nr:aminoacyl-tRNA hydrolase [Salinivirgaceae bacterium]
MHDLEKGPTLQSALFHGKIYLMKVIVGFGNPGSKYNFTRHNTGFLALDFYAKIHKLDWQNKPKFNAFVAKDDEHNILLVKPQTFYNESGQSLRTVLDFYKLTPQDFLVICDDFNLEFGKLRFRERGSTGGNNGLKSTVQHFGTEDFPRLRIGTANDTLRSRIGDTDFVLGRFTDSEYEKLPEILREIANFIAKY